jgi:putative ABC transport system substrate-binding protein
MRSNHSRRREFIALVGGASAWPLSARAQGAGQVRRVGVLMNNVPTERLYQSYMTTLVQALQTLGWRDGRNLHLDIRWSAGDPERIRSYAEELVGLTPDVIVSSSTANLVALLRATRTIPIVFVLVSDPVAQGFVPNLVHPGGNITGFSAYELSMGGKWLDLLKQMAPNLAQIGVMSNPDTSPQSKLFLRSIEAAASSFGVTTVAAPVHNEAEINQGIENLARNTNSGLLLLPDTFTSVHDDLIMELTTRYHLPAIYATSEVAVHKGGLMYYGIDYESQFRQAAIYVDRILKGAKPGDLPIQSPTTFKLIINLTAARVLGIEVPMGLMLRADEMIE